MFMCKKFQNMLNFHTGMTNLVTCKVTDIQQKTGDTCIILNKYYTLTDIMLLSSSDLKYANYKIRNVIQVGKQNYF